MLDRDRERAREASKLLGRSAEGCGRDQDPGHGKGDFELEIIKRSIKKSVFDLFEFSLSSL